MRNIINSAVDGDFAAAKKWGIGIIILVATELLIFVVSKFLAAQMTARLEMAFRESVFSKLLKKEYSALSVYHSGELQNRLFNDVRIVSENVATLVPQVLALFTKLLAALGAVYIVDPIFAGAILLVGIGLFVFARLFRNVLKKTHKDVQAASGEVRSQAQEAVENVLVIKAFGMEDKMEDAQKTLHKKEYKKKMVRAMFSTGASAGFTTLMYAGRIYAVLWGATKILIGAPGFGYGDFTAILQLIGQIQTPFASLSGSLSKYYSIIASTERLLEICDMPEDSYDKIAQDDVYKKMSAIKVADMSFSYGRSTIFEGADAAIEKGKLTVISGISGIGKSTLIKLMMGVIKPLGGEVYVETEEGKVALSASTRDLFAYVPQGNLLMSGTVADNLRLAKADATEEEMNVALRVACAEFVFELPEGLETLLGERGSGLSEGQVQRLAIARAVLFGAPIFLLDEATSALDEITEKKVLENIMALSDKTCVCISHRPAAREVCDKEIYIKDGKVCERE